MFHFTKKLWGLQYRFGWENIHYWNKREADFNREPQFTELTEGGGEDVVWDIGSNIGLWSLWAASYRRCYKVFSFDSSLRANRFLTWSTKANHLTDRVVVVGKPLTESLRHYRPSLSAHQANTLTDGTHWSMPWMEAARITTTPCAIKMDIEGGELEFLGSRAFMEWIKEFDIQLFVECHSPWAREMCRYHDMEGRGNHFFR